MGLFLVLVFVELVYVGFVSAGQFTIWPTYMAYNDLLAEGFRSGHLYLSLSPSPELLSQQNPFDPKFSHLWLGDASLHGGHFYLYFGPVPALLLAVVKTVFRISRPVGEQYLVFWFFSMGAVAGALLVIRMTQRLFVHPPFFLVAASVLALALTNPVLHLLASSSVYQSAVAGGQAFMLVGVALSMEIVSTPSDRAPRTWQVLASGTAYALAIGCRLTLAPAIVLLVVTTAIWTGLRAGSPWRLIAKIGAGLAAPLVVGCIALLLYNKLRFDAWFDFGHSKQLTTWPVRTSVRYLPANLFTYLARSPVASCHFPYAIVPYEMPIDQALPRWIAPAEGSMAPEPVAGFLVTNVCSWAIPAAFVFAIGRLRRFYRNFADNLARPALGENGRDRIFLWCVTTFTIMGTISGAIPLVFYLTTMRYLGDMSFGLALLGILGLWTLFTHARSRSFARKVTASLFVVACLATAVFGMLLGYQGYTGHFQTFNPPLHEKLERMLSVCE